MRGVEVLAKIRQLMLAYQQDLQGFRVVRRKNAHHDKAQRMIDQVDALSLRSVGGDVLSSLEYTQRQVRWEAPTDGGRFDSLLFACKCLLLAARPPLSCDAVSVPTSLPSEALSACLLRAQGNAARLSHLLFEYLPEANEQDGRFIFYLFLHLVQLSGGYRVRLDIDQLARAYQSMSHPLMPWQQALLVEMNDLIAEADREVYRTICVSKVHSLSRENLVTIAYGDVYCDQNLLVRSAKAGSSTALSILLGINLPNEETTLYIIAHATVAQRDQWIVKYAEYGRFHAVRLIEEHRRLQSVDVIKKVYCDDQVGLIALAEKGCEAAVSVLLMIKREALTDYTMKYLRRCFDEPDSDVGRPVRTVLSRMPASQRQRIFIQWLTVSVGMQRLLSAEEVLTQNSLAGLLSDVVVKSDDMGARVWRAHYHQQCDKAFRDEGEKTAFQHDCEQVETIDQYDRLIERYADHANEMLVALGVVNGLLSAWTTLARLTLLAAIVNKYAPSDQTTDALRRTIQLNILRRQAERRPLRLKALMDLPVTALLLMSKQDALVAMKCKAMTACAEATTAQHALVRQYRARDVDYAALWAGHVEYEKRGVYEIDGDEVEEVRQHFKRRMCSLFAMRCEEAVEGARQAALKSMVSFHMMNAGLSNKKFFVDSENEASGFNVVRAYGWMLNAFGEYIRSIPIDERGEGYLDLVMIESELREDKHIAPDVYRKPLRPLRDRIVSGEVVSIASGWWSAPKGTSTSGKKPKRSGHAVAISFFEVDGITYLAYANRGGRSAHIKKGITLYRVGNPEQLNNEAFLKRISGETTLKAYLECVSDKSREGLAKDLDLSEALGTLDKSNQKGGLCTLAAVNHAILVQLMVKQLQTERPKGCVSFAQFKVAYEQAKTTYKDFRHFSRRRSIYALVTLGSKESACRMERDAHQNVLKLIIDYVKSKLGEDSLESRSENKADLLAPVVELLYSVEGDEYPEKDDMLRAISEVTGEEIDLHPEASHTTAEAMIP